METKAVVGFLSPLKMGGNRLEKIKHYSGMDSGPLKGKNITRERRNGLNQICYKVMGNVCLEILLGLTDFFIYIFFRNMVN